MLPFNVSLQTLSSSTLLPVFIVLAACSFCLVLIRLRTSSKQPIPPGPPFYSLLLPGPVRDFHISPTLLTQSLETLFNIYGDVFTLWLGPSRVVVTSNPADIVHMSSDPKLFPRGHNIRRIFALFAPGGLFNMDYSLHRVARRKLRDKFNHTMLQGFHDALSKAVTELCAELKIAADKGDPVDISMHVSATTFLIILQVGFGFDMERDERHRFATDVNFLVRELMTEYTHMPLRKALALFGSRDKMHECVKRISATCNRFIKARLSESARQKAARRQDMLDAILELGVHSQEVVASVVVEFALAGYHTTSQILVWSLYQTCCAPHVVAKIHSEIEEKLGDRPLDVPLTMGDVESLSYIKDVWKETLRLHPSGATIVRMAAKDITLRGSGYHVPKGTEIYGHVRASQRSSSYWKDGASFKPDRWRSSKKDLDAGQTLAGVYLPFGVGQLNCAGRFLADYESLLLLAEIHRRFTFQLACEPSDVKMQSLIVDMPRIMDKESGVESGIQLLVEARKFL